MLNSLVCGASHLPEEEHDIDELLSACAKSTQKKHKKTKADNKNPYANRGLDKFNALLDELDSMKQKIYTQKGSQDISFVRFVYSSNDDWKPIVVKAKERKQLDQNQRKNHKTGSFVAGNSEEKEIKLVIAKSGSAEKVVQETKGKISIKRDHKKSARFRWGFKIEYLRQPSWYMPVMIIMIMFLVITCGRTFAILCLSIGWYLVPMIEDSKSKSSLNLNSNTNLSFKKSREKKKEYGRRFSEKNIVPNELTSPKSVLSGPAEKSPGRHAHRKSW